MSWILKPIFYFIIDFLGLRVQKKNKENIEKNKYEFREIVKWDLWMVWGNL
jgi:hypothetical protein